MNILSFFPQNFASTKCVSRRCSTDSTPTCTPLYLRIVAALIKRIVARCTPNRRVESWNAPCATLTCSTFHTNVPADQITRPALMHQLAFPPPASSVFFSFPQRWPPRQFCLARYSAMIHRPVKRRVHHRHVSNISYIVSILTCSRN